jgi:GNAT superfamily N-acetyltransferase
VSDDLTNDAADSHPLLQLLLAASEGRYPAVDGGVTLVPPLNDGMQAIVSFTGHVVLATAAPSAELGNLRLDGFGDALQPAILQYLAGPGWRVGGLDVTLTRNGLGGESSLKERHDLVGHPRVQHARSLCHNVRVLADDRGLVTLAAGLAGRLELSVKVIPSLQGTGAGRQLINQALHLVPSDQPVFAAVAPGNARSLRAFLSQGFMPIGSEIIMQKELK